MTVRGELWERIQKSLAYQNQIGQESLSAQPKRSNRHIFFSLESPSEQYHWGADYPGRWLDVMLLADHWLGLDNPNVKAVFERFLKHQRRDGSFGFGLYENEKYRCDEQSHFGNGRGLNGLIECWNCQKNARALEAAEKLAEHCYSNFRRGLGVSEGFSQCLEGMVQVGQATGKDAYLAWARDIAHGSKIFSGNIGGHSHSQLMVMRGMLNLYEATGETVLLDIVRELAETIRTKHMWITGGIAEGFPGGEWTETWPPVHRDETCSVADWLRLNLQLWRLTADPVYMHTAETTLLNHLYFDQAIEGGFYCWKTLQGQRGGIADHCCSMHGLRALLEVPRYIYSFDRASRLVFVNLFLSSKASLILADGYRVEIEQEASEPGTHGSAIRVRTNQVGNFGLKIRVPEWASNFAAHIGRLRCDGKIERGYFTIERLWPQGQTSVTLQWIAKVRVVTGYPLSLIGPENLMHKGIYGLPNDIDQSILRVEKSEAVAVTHGPIVYGLSMQNNPHSMDAYRAFPEEHAYAVDQPQPPLIRGRCRVMENDDPREVAAVFSPLTALAHIGEKSREYRVWIEPARQPSRKRE